MELSENLYFSFRRFTVAIGDAFVAKPGEPGWYWNLDWELEYSFESCALDVERRELRCGGKLRHVEPQIFDLLYFLIINRERVVSRDKIFQAVWHGRIVSDVVLSSCLNAVRTAIEDDGTQQRLIHTLYGKGFRFVGALFAVTNPWPALAIVPPYRFAVVLKDTPIASRWLPHLQWSKSWPPNVPLWLHQQESRWSNGHDHQKYVGAFRMAGMT